jgi:hypothetical protein
LCECVKRGLHGLRIACGADLLQPLHLVVAHRMVVDVERLDRIFLRQLVLVDADDHVLAGVDASLLLGGTGLDLELGPTALHRLRHAAHRIDFFDDGPGRIGHVLRELLHHVAAGPGVDHVRDVRLFLDDELRVACDARAELARQRDGFVERVGVQALRAAEHGRHRFDGGAHDIVVRVLLGEAPAGGLAVRAQHQALGVLRLELVHDLPPQQPRRAHLGHLEVEVHADGPEEREPAGELVNVQSLGQRRLHVLLAVGQREGELERLVRPGLLHVVTRDRDRVELGHLLRRVLDDVADGAHARLGREDVGVADHELLEDVVLDGPAQLVLRHALLFGRHHVAGQHRQHGAIHRHRDRHLVQRDAVEQDLHVLDAVDRHAGLAGRRRSHADGHCHSRGEWRGRRPRSHLARRPPAHCDRTRSMPRR